MSDWLHICGGFKTLDPTTAQFSAQRHPPSYCRHTTPICWRQNLYGGTSAAVLSDSEQNNERVRNALDAKTAGLSLITWTLERSGNLADGNGGWYYQTTNGPELNSEGATMEVLHVLAKDVGILGIFSDWPATVTYYANCMGLK